MAHIKPLKSFKKQNPELYKQVKDLSLYEALSAKQKENDWYFNYCFLELFRDEGCETKDVFFWDVNGEPTNKTTVSECGRLLLAGWYYSIADFTLNIVQHIKTAFYKKQDFNDLQFSEAVKHIRENIGFYHQNESQLQIYLLNTFFNDEYKKLLPEKPQDLKNWEKMHDTIVEMQKNRIKKGVKHWIEEAGEWEDYALYLQEILDDFSIEYLSKEEFWIRKDAKSQEWYNSEISKVKKLEEEYNQKVFKIFKQKQIGSE